MTAAKQQARYVAVMDVGCPWCDARPRAPCRTRAGRARAEVHRVRWERLSRYLLARPIDAPGGAR